MTLERPERWSLDVGDGDVALLTIPAVLNHDRVFEIDVRFVVRNPLGSETTWHALSVELDGVREWSRRLPTPAEVGSDSLDHHCRRLIPAGQPLRIRATTQVGPATRRHRLVIEAEQALD